MHDSERGDRLHESGDNRGVPGYAWLIVLGGWLLWGAPFYRVRHNRQAAAMMDTRARWGIAVQTLAYVGVSVTSAWASPPAAWRVALSAVFYLLAGLLTWTSVMALGKQWRLDAGLNADHELVRRGAYRWVRHPIYTSMICMLWGMGFLMAPLAILAAATALMVIGTEIRVRIEDGLLERRFGGEFLAYRRGVAAYIPGLR
jgi:protein-S-isoprenylcysteine O-methyltransferase Ste14